MAGVCLLTVAICLQMRTIWPPTVVVCLQMRTIWLPMVAICLQMIAVCPPMLVIGGPSSGISGRSSVLHALSVLA